MAAKQSRARQWEFFDRQSDVAKERGMKRVQILDQVEHLTGVGMTKTEAVCALAELEQIGKSTIWIWLSLVEGVSRHDWLAYLTPGFKGGGRRADINETILAIIAADYLRPERPAWAECVRRLQEIAKERGIKLPHPRTIWRRFERKHGRVTIARWRGEEMPAWLNARYPANDR